MIKILQEAAEAGGQVLIKYFTQGVLASEKTSQHNLVTEADLASQKVIYTTLLKSMTAQGYRKEEIGFIGEEKLNIPGKYQFVIDPLDGTNNFASGLNYFSVSIALFEKGRLTTGLIYDPVHQEFYLGEKDQGASKLSPKGKAKLSLDNQDLKKSLLAIYLNSDPQIRNREFLIYKKLYPKFREIRSTGSTALDICKLAENIFGGVINGHCSIWDIAAADVILRESGGLIVDWQGNEIKFDLNQPEKLYQFIAAHPQNLAVIQKGFSTNS